MTASYSYFGRALIGSIEVGQVYMVGFPPKTAFTITAIYETNDPDRVFFNASVGEGIDPGGAYNSTPPLSRISVGSFDVVVYIAGNITDDGLPLESVVLNPTGGSTDENGDYLSQGLASPATETLTPALHGYSFTPASRTYSGITTNKVDGYITSLTLPGKPTTPAPTHENEDVLLGQATISWVSGGDTDTYNVYFGEDAGSLVLVSEAQVGISFTVTGITNGSPFDYKTSRAWRIDATNDDGTTTGDVWTFTSIVYAPPGPSWKPIDGGNGQGPGEGEEGTDWGWSGENNMLTVRRLIVAADDKILYESIP